MRRKIKGYGWTPDLPDGRDLLYAAPVEALVKLPAKVDFRKHCPDVYNQGQLGSCTANAIGGALEFEQMKQHQNGFTPSRLFIYYNERVIEGTVNSDSGAMLRDGMKTVARQGACKETPDLAVQDRQVRQQAAKGRVHPGQEAPGDPLSAAHPDVNQLKGCLASGFPFVFGFAVYESFESPQVANTGQVPMPQSNEAFLGGHAVMAVGYDEAKQRFIVRNSWGKNWGMNGYFTMPYPYLLQRSLSSDFWTIRRVE